MSNIKDEINNGEWLVLQIRAVQGCEYTKAQVLNILRSMAGQRVSILCRELVIPERTRRAVELLDKGNTLSQIRESLVAGGFCHSKKTANRVISMALNVRRQRFAPSTFQQQGAAVVTRHTAPGEDD